MLAGQGLGSDEIQEFRQLIEIEKIRRKRHLYAHLFDSLQLERWVELFAEDAVGDWGSLGTWVGRAALYNAVRESTVGRAPYYAMHMTTNMWIELTGPTTAMSCCYLHDFNNDLSLRINPLKLLGVYEDDWQKIAGDWKIKRQRFQLLWPERSRDEEFPRPMQPGGRQC